jgi:hypothetical protein
VISSLDPVLRVVTGVQINNMVKDIDMFYNENATEAEVKNLETFLKEKGINVPDYTVNKQLSADIKKTMYRAWHIMQTLDMMCKLIGDQKQNEGNHPVSRFESLME